MKQGGHQSTAERGSTLIEVVIAIGVFAAALPLVVCAMDECGSNRRNSGAETRCAWVVSACVEEVRASRAGKSKYLPNTIAGAFPPDDDVWALAFSAQGELVGRLSREAYLKGTRELGGRGIHYIGTVSASRAEVGPDAEMRLRISVEHPAAVPAGKRGKMDSYMMIP